VIEPDTGPGPTVRLDASVATDARRPDSALTADSGSDPDTTIATSDADPSTPSDAANEKRDGSGTFGDGAAADSGPRDAALSYDAGPTGNVVFTDSFSAATLNGWRVAREGWTLVNGTLKGSQSTSDPHRATIVRSAPGAVVYTFSVQFDGAAHCNLMVNHIGTNSEHLFRATFERDNQRFLLSRMSGWGPSSDPNGTSAGQVGTAPFPFVNGRWYKVRVDYLNNRRVRTSIDDKVVFEGDIGDRTGKPPGDVALMVSGSSASFDDVAVYR
jgi:hypothetical protein